MLQRNVDRLRIFGYNYQGYAKRIDSVNSYFQVNMDLRDSRIWHELLLKDMDHRIYTKIKDEAPAKYMEESHVSNSLVANGCIIEGRVENSILFRRVKVGKMLSFATASSCSTRSSAMTLSSITSYATRIRSSSRKPC